MAKSVLRIQYEYPFEVVGIASSVREYRLCHHLNRVMRLNLIRREDLEIILNKQGDDARFILFEQEAEEDEKVMLIGNKGNKAWFFPEIRNVDYLLVFHEPGSLFEKPAILKQLREIEVITGAYDIDFEKLKSKENLLYLV